MVVTCFGNQNGILTCLFESSWENLLSCHIKSGVSIISQREEAAFLSHLKGQNQQQQYRAYYYIPPIPLEQLDITLLDPASDACCCCQPVDQTIIKTRQFPCQCLNPEHLYLSESMPTEGVCELSAAETPFSSLECHMFGCSMQVFVNYLYAIMSLRVENKVQL